MQHLLHILSSVIVLGLLFSIPAAAQEGVTQIPDIKVEKADLSSLRNVETVTVAQVLDPLRLRLSDQRIVQLSSLDFPDLTSNDIGDNAAAALDYLRLLLENKKVRLFQTRTTDKGRTNRMGYHLAHIETADGDIWVQGTLLRLGLARVQPSDVMLDMAIPMQAAEDAARQDKLGLWAEGTKYKIQTPETASDAMNGWAIVEGTIKKAAMANNVVYLNFGNDWKTDFTVGISPAVRRAFAKAGADPLSLNGKTVRVRGWVESYNGPYIPLLAPVWLQVLPAPAEGSSLPQ